MLDALNGPSVIWVSVRCGKGKLTLYKNFSVGNKTQSDGAVTVALSIRNQPFLVFILVPSIVRFNLLCSSVMC